MALRATFYWVKLRLPTTLEGPGAINVARKNVAPKNLSASKPQIEISRSCWSSVIIYYPQFRLKKAQKHTQQQKNVVAGKNLPYVKPYSVCHVLLAPTTPRMYPWGNQYVKNNQDSCQEHPAFSLTPIANKSFIPKYYPNKCLNSNLDHFPGR